jgi:DNA-binding XRE family transcriptional regulator
MKTKLKQFRVNAGMTQAKVAAAVGVAQPNYHRWEVGAAPIPKPKLKKLAKFSRRPRRRSSVDTRRSKRGSTMTRSAKI